MIKTIVAGAGGRMGGRIINIINSTDGIELSGAFERPDSDAVGRDAGEIAGAGTLGVAIADSLDRVIDSGDVIIDFTFHEATVRHAEKAAEKGRAMVIGTTGFSSDEYSRLKGLSKSFPCVLAPNMSVGVNLLYKLLETAAHG